VRSLKNVKKAKKLGKVSLAIWQKRKREQRETTKKPTFFWAMT
jgi:hypothetical protein